MLFIRCLALCRALVNWGKALVGRAELAVERVAASKLYNAAIDKFEAVLEEDPEMLVAKYRCALAMQVSPHIYLVARFEFLLGCVGVHGWGVLVRGKVAASMLHPS